MQELFILGNGAMASALAHGLRDKYQIYLIGREAKKLESLKNEGFKTLLYEEFDPSGKALILAFKPYALEGVAESLKRDKSELVKIRSMGEAKFIISVLANVNLSALECLRAQNYARIMPNTAARFKSSITPFVLKNEAHRAEILEILTSFGEALELANEAQMSAAMALSGCAPAFLALVAEALAEGGVHQGLSARMSQKLALGAFKSTAALLEHERASVIKERICSPGGVTIKGVAVLEDEKVRAAFIKAVIASSS